MVDVKYQLDPKDQVTVIRFNKADGLVHIDTFDKGLIESLNAAQKKEPVMFIVSEPDRYGCVSAICPEALLDIGFHSYEEEWEKDKYRLFPKCEGLAELMINALCEME